MYLIYKGFLLLKNLIYIRLKQGRGISLFSRYSEVIFKGRNSVRPLCDLQNVQMGLYSYCNKNTKIYDCRIGNFVSIGESVHIGGFSAHNFGISQHPSFHSPNPPIGESFYIDRGFEANKRIIIGHDVLIGSHAMVLDGVDIGTGVIVAAGALVAKDVPPYAIVAGNPAKVIKFRFAESEIEKLLKSEWWNWSLEKLKAQGKILNNDDVNAL